MGIKITGDKRVLLARNTPARRDLDEQFRSLSDVVLGRQNTHPALPLLLPALDLQLLLVLPVGKKRVAYRSDGVFYRPLWQHFLCWPTCVDRFQQPFLCLFSPSALLLWPLCLSSLSPAAGAPPAPCNAPPADVSPLLSGNNDRLATLAFDWSL